MLAHENLNIAAFLLLPGSNLLVIRNGLPLGTDRTTITVLRAGAFVECISLDEV
jgi:hypothetical protein